MTTKTKIVAGFCAGIALAATGFFALHYLDQDHWTTLMQGLAQIVAGSAQ